jgi:hypothetical protein
VPFEGAQWCASSFFNAYFSWSVDSTGTVPAQIRPRPCGLSWQGDPVDVGHLATLAAAELEPVFPGDEPDRA